MNTIILSLIASVLINIYLIIRLIFTQGVLEIDNSNKDKPRWLFLFTMSTDDIPKYRRLVFKIKDVTELIKESKDAEKSDPNMKED